MGEIFDLNKLVPKKPYEKPTITKMVDSISALPELKSPTPEPPKPKPEDKSLVEKELSPEQIEKIMEKVQDINKFGTAYRGIKGFNLVQHNGLIDTAILRGGFGGIPHEKGINAKELREVEKRYGLKFEQKGVVFFHIIGRTIDIPDDLDTFDLKTGDEAFLPNIRPGNVSFIFSLDDYKEVVGWGTPSAVEKYNESGFPTRYGLRDREYSIQGFFFSYPDEIIQKYKPHEEISEEDKKKIKTPKEFGFIITGRVTPDKFRGIVIGTGKSKEEIEQEGRLNLEKERSVLKIDILAKQIKDEFEKTKEDHSLLPIYDVHGNLLWPKQMNYAEVKKLAEERDKEKEE